MRKILPTLGSQRIIHKLIVFPVTLPNKDGDVETRWLEHSFILQECCDNHYLQPFWLDKRWATVHEYQKYCDREKLKLVRKKEVSNVK